MKKFKISIIDLIKYGALAAFILCALVLIIESSMPGKISGAHSDKFGDLLDVPVDKIVEPESLILTDLSGNSPDAAVCVNQSFPLVPHFEPENTTFKQVKWLVDGEATVGEDGVITFLGEGEVTVTAVSLVDERIKNSFCFNVKKATPSEVTIHAPTFIDVGETAMVSASFIPFYSQCDYTLSSSSPCLTVDGNRVTGVSEGVAVIFASIGDEVMSQTEITVRGVDSTLDFMLGDEKITELSASVGEKVKINCLISGPRNVEWSSDIPLCFIASDWFYVMPVRSGSFTVTATVGGKRFALNVVASGEALSDHVTGIVASDLTLYKGEYRSLDITMTDDGAPAYSEPEYFCEGGVVSVDSVGRIYGSEEGTATVTIKVGEVSALVTVEVKIPPVSEIDILVPNHEPIIGEDYPLGCIARPVFAQADVSWVSSDEHTAVIDNGVVSFFKAGSVTITAFAQGKSGSVTLTAYNLLDVTGLSFDGVDDLTSDGNGYEATMPMNSSAFILPVFGINASYFDFELASSDENVLTVTDNVVYARKKGVADITVTYSDGFSPNEQVFTVSIEVVEQRLSDTVSNYGRLIRKGLGHFAAFLITGIFASVAFMLLIRRKYIAFPTVLVAGFSLAGLTELIQMITPNRGPSMSDVLLDFNGFCFTALPIMLVFAIVYIVKFIKDKNSRS